jgi:hypothetical protein
MMDENRHRMEMDFYSGLGLGKMSSYGHYGNLDFGITGGGGGDPSSSGQPVRFCKPHFLL